MDSNTGENRPINKGQFVKGDKRINRKGRPKNFDMLRTLAIIIANEPMGEGDNRMTQVENIIRDWLKSHNFQKQKAALELAYGKVPESVNLNFDKPIIINWQEDDRTDNN